MIGQEDILKLHKMAFGLDIRRNLFTERAVMLEQAVQSSGTVTIPGGV